MYNNTPTFLPNQAVSYAVKKRKGFQMMKDSARYYLSMAHFKDDIEHLYKYANGSYIDTRKNGRYKKLLNPLGLTGATKEQRRILEKGNAVELKNFPIIAPVVAKFMGEMRSRSNDYIVEAINADVTSKRTQALLDIINKHTDQQLFNTLNEAGVDTGMPTVEQPPIEEVVKTFNASYVDERAVLGQQAINIIVEECKLLEKRYVLFYDWVVAGWAITYKSVDKDRIISEVVSIMDFWYMHSNDIQFVEDTEAQVRRIRNYPVEKLAIKFPELTKEELKEIQNHYGISFATGKYVSGDIHTGYVSGRSGEQQNAGHLTDIHHIVWRSKKYRGTLRFIDALGEEQVDFVDEDYVFSEENGDIELIDDWVDEYWECYEYMPDKFTTPKPLDVQRNTFAGEAKSCYNGRAFSDRYADNVSIVKLGEDFQQEVNEIRYRVARTLAKNKDNVLLLDISVIPNKPGFTRDDFMHFLEEFGVAFIDRSQKGADRGFNQYTVLQASQIEAVAKGYELMLTWRGFYWDLVGMNPQRLGKVGTSAGKGVTEDAIQASSEISEEHFARFEEMEERDMQGYLDLSKFAWREGKQATYKRGDDDLVFFDVAGDDWSEMEHRVFAKKAGAEKLKVKAFKEMLLPIIQNSGQQGVKSSLVASLLDHDSMSELKKLAKEFDEAEAKAMQAQTEQQQQHEQQMAQMVEQSKEAERMEKRYLQEREHNNKITLKLMDISAQDTAYSGIDTPIDVAGIQDASIRLQAENNKKYLEERKLALQKEKQDSDARLGEMKIVMEKYKADNQLKVARANKNKYDSKAKSK